MTLHFKYIPRPCYTQLWSGADWWLANERGEIAPTLKVTLWALTENGFLAFKERYPEPEELSPRLTAHRCSEIDYFDLIALDAAISRLDFCRVPGDTLELPERAVSILERIGDKVLWAEPPTDWVTTILDSMGQE